MIKNIIILGVPGAGKGTICNLLAQYHQIRHISTGDIFRNEIKEQSLLGKKVQEYVTSGKYVPDDVTNQIVLKTLQSNVQKKQRFILDGFPRTIPQAKFLAANNIKIDLAIVLDVEEKIILERLSGRRICPSCNRTYHLSFKPPKKHLICDFDNQSLKQRSDDFPEKIQKRIQIYRKETLILLDHYHSIIKHFDSGYNANLVMKQIWKNISKNDTIKV